MTVAVLDVLWGCLGDVTAAAAEADLSPGLALAEKMRVLPHVRFFGDFFFWDEASQALRGRRGIETLEPKTPG